MEHCISWKDPTWDVVVKRGPDALILVMGFCNFRYFNDNDYETKRSATKQIWYSINAYYYYVLNVNLRSFEIFYVPFRRTNVSRNSLLNKMFRICTDLRIVLTSGFSSKNIFWCCKNLVFFCLIWSKFLTDTGYCLWISGRFVFLVLNK